VLVKIRCPNCDEIVRIASSHLGGRALCPGCQVIFTVDKSNYAGNVDETGGTKISKAKVKKATISSLVGILIIVGFTMSLLYLAVPSEDLLARSKIMVTKINSALEESNPEEFLQGLFSEANAETSDNVAVIKSLKNISVLKTNPQPEQEAENVKSFICEAEEKETGRKLKLVFMVKVNDDGDMKILSLSTAPEEMKVDAETPVK